MRSGLQNLMRIIAVSFASELRDENDIPIDYTAAYDKQYLDGRYGATPYLRNILLEEL